MSERPKLDKGLNGETFRNYYYLKKESMDFCRKNNRPVLGSKVELADRIIEKYVEQLDAVAFEEQQEVITGGIKYELYADHERKY